MNLADNLAPFQSSDLLNALFLGLGFTLAFWIAKQVQARFPIRKELARKTGHVLGGLLALTFPYVIHDARVVGLMGLGFLIFLIVMRKSAFLNAIHGVERKSWGAYLFPVSIVLIFFLAQGKPQFYFISILVLTLSDSAAALIGQRYGSIPIRVEGNLKSLEGSLVFGVLTFLSVQIPLLLMTTLAAPHCIVIALIAALAVTGFELLALSGTDNLFIPLGTFYTINRLSQFPADIAVVTLAQFILSIAILFLVFAKIKSLDASWKIAMSLLLFASFSLSGFYCPLPTVLFFGVLALLRVVFPPAAAPGLSAKAALRLGVIPAALLFLAAGLEEHKLFYPIYLTALTLGNCLMAVELMTPKPRPGLFQARFRLGLVLVVIFTSIVLIPVLVYAKIFWVGNVLGLCGLGVFGGLACFWALARHASGFYTRLGARLTPEQASLVSLGAGTSLVAVLLFFVKTVKV